MLSTSNPRAPHIPISQDEGPPSSATHSNLLLPDSSPLSSSASTQAQGNDWSFDNVPTNHASSLFDNGNVGVATTNEVRPVTVSTSTVAILQPTTSNTEPYASILSPLESHAEQSTGFSSRSPSRSPSEGGGSIDAGDLDHDTHQTGYPSPPDADEDASSEPNSDTNHANDESDDESAFRVTRSRNRPLPQTLRHQTKAYKLRRNARRKPPQAWINIDDDDTGDYDPDAERKGTIVGTPPKKRKLDAIAPESDDEYASSDGGIAAYNEAVRQNSNTSKKSMTWLKARQLGKSLVVEMVFKSERGRQRLKELKETHGDNWPQEPHNFLDEEDVPLSEVCDTGNQSYKLRKRKRIQSVPPVAIPDPLEEHADLSNHPCARGCMDCREREIECSLASDHGGAKWPCAECRKTSQFCQMLTPPTYKDACLSCKEERIDCSYKQDFEEHHRDCEHCEANGIKCEAGPHPNKNYVRLSLDKYSKPGAPKPPPRTAVSPRQQRKAAGKSYTACSACRRERKRCSLKKHDDGPCNSCQKQNMACSFDTIPPKDKKGKKVTFDLPPIVESSSELSSLSPEPPSRSSSKRKAQPAPELSEIRKFCRELRKNPDMPEPPRYKLPSPDPNADYYMTDAYDNRGKYATIRTPFAHPMHFNYRPQAQARGQKAPIACHFCPYERSLFGLIGCGPPKDVEVIAWDDQKGYTELFKGWIEHGGYNPTIMCPTCTGDRVKIVICPNHKIVRIPGTDYLFDDKAAEEACTRLLEKNAENTEMWCSICINPATYRCRADQETDIAGNCLLPKEGNGKGCGLMLCKECEEALRGKFEYDMPAFLKKVEERLLSGVNDGDIRADVGLLRYEGLLMMNVGSE